MGATLTFWDSAFPVTDHPATDGVCFYIGGDTPHIWSAAEITAQRARYRLPVFVRSNPARASAATDVSAAVRQLTGLKAPKGCLVAWDVETAVNAAYVQDAYQRLKTAGYVMIVYGSQASVFGNDVPDDLYWGADWTGIQHIHLGDEMTQYVAFSAYDESVAVSSLPFWDTQPSSPSGSEPDWQVNLMNALLTLQPGATGQLVRTAQGLCCARGRNLIIDGNFGPVTEAAVRSLQASAGVTDDGVIGPETWPALMGVS
jgi:hypothetical protein